MLDSMIKELVIFTESEYFSTNRRRVVVVRMYNIYYCVCVITQF